MTTHSARALREILSAPAGRRVGVLGLGKVGRAMTRHLIKRGARVVAADTRADAAQGLVGLDVELRLGPMDARTFVDVEALALSPGADPRQPAAQEALRRGIPLLGELELAGTLPAKVLAVTGTNGKSTTTTLAGELLRGLGQRVFVGGNLGTPVLEWLDSGQEVDVAVLELSSFQLETAYSFAPDVSVVLNVTPDHVDRYDSFEEYALTKERLVLQTRPGGTAVLSADDPRVRQMGTRAPCRVWSWTLGDVSVAQGVAVAGDALRAWGDAAPLDGMSLAHPRLLGRHSRENAAAAFLAVTALGCISRQSRGQAEAAYLAFPGLPHRLEIVAEVGGVLYVNDSKATNDEAAAVALRAVTRPTILLLGGRDKGAGYGQVRRAATQVRRVVAFGEAQPQIEAELSGALPVERADNMQAALRRATALARPGDVVLLAPACSSFDAFRNFEDRGDTFKRLVRQMLEKGP